MKTCTKCKVKKDTSEFSKDKRRIDGLQLSCKECRRNYYLDHREKTIAEAYTYRQAHKEEIAKNKRRYEKEHKEEIAKRRKAYREENMELFREREYLYKYGITLQQKYEMWESQDARCLGCKKEVDINKIHVDHNHDTGEIRGLLCTQCNSIIGLAYENIQTLLSLVEYLREYNHLSLLTT